MKKLAPSFWPLSALLFSAQGLFVALYAGRETPLYFWDYAMYFDMAKALFHLNGAAFWGFFTDSFSQNYNLLFALPSLLGFSLFGATRLVFLETNFLFFFFAQEVALALILRRVYGFSLSRAFLWAFGLSSLLPFFWHPLLHGYPDHGAATCLGFALFFALGDKRGWREALFFGLLLGLAVLFRRHFAYPALALIAVSGLFDFWAARWRPTKQFIFFYGLAGATALALLLVCAPSYFQTMLQTDFQSLYKSYEKPHGTFLLFLLGRMGPVLLLPVLAGYALAFRALPSRRKKLLFVPSFFLLWLFLWTLGPAQASEHYLIAALPVFCLVGLTGLFLNLPKKIFAVALLLLLSGNAAYALWFAPEPSLPGDPPHLSFFSAPSPPWVRDDYDTLIELARALEQTSRDGDHLAVVSSSFILNQDLFRTLYLDVLKRPTALSRFLFVSEVDHVQPPPFDVLAGANIFVVPEPRQYHLDPEGQKVQTALASLFPPPDALASFFEKDPREFVLARGVKVHVWRRKKPWTPDALHLALSLMRQKADAPLYWVAEKRGVGVTSDITSVFLRFDVGRPSARLFLDRPLSPGTYRLGMDFSAQPACTQPHITTRLRNGGGQVLYEKKAAPFANPWSFFAPLTLRDDGGSFAYLSFDVTVRAFGPCSVTLENLRLDVLP